LSLPQDGLLHFIFFFNSGSSFPAASGSSDGIGSVNETFSRRASRESPKTDDKIIKLK
jgi:hypothetical protein